MAIITGVILATMMFITGGFASSKVYAADESAKYIKGATFISAVHGQTEDGTEIVLALYEKNNQDIAYLNDGIEHVFIGLMEDVIIDVLLLQSVLGK